MAPTFPPPPVNTIDWNDIGFKVREVNGHVSSTFSYKTGKWTTPCFVEDPYLRIHGMAPGLNYGQQCYEGLKAFRTPDDKSITIFRPTMNAERMQHSAEFISIPEVPVDLFNQCVHLAVSLNAEFVPPHSSGAAMYIRPLLFGSSAQLGLNPPEEYTFLVYVLPVGVYHGVHPVSALILEDFDRAAPEGTGSAKIGGNYAPVLRFSERARKEGFGITLHLDSRTRSEIDEFSTSGFIGVRGDASKEGESVTIVVPDSKNVIKSVTSDSVCQIAKSWGWKVEKRSIKYEELPQFNEVLAAGTAAALVPIKSITMRSKGDEFKYQGGGDEPGPAIVKLLAQLKGIQSGKVKDTFGWCQEVQPIQDGQYEREPAKSNGVAAPGQLP
ncbi:branched-chain amino acid aminotransferase [Hortaea werneckii]|uniref:Branched-chain amino acid aminotransferase n=1 Tax=Hortaea werneckii TaxID=91943 RepID=A0A3M7J1G3_HORWE|nr:branched-chain amino acid aminotransferase [Hortaea werneckii]KAI6816303.1 branched-chain amino acid aminotransferase [Hortaea werneckii]KAI6928573.1 branched-chain amino acid aminotransferase [Hortaea werneckii]KAI6935050.1 branched-chain amino acid aminotransferase [Hortaea werneckii]KAI6962554.1 branched-chain amino acid aminotransferase [Hortaea werneckii]